MIRAGGNLQSAHLCFVFSWFWQLNIHNGVESASTAPDCIKLRWSVKKIKISFHGALLKVSIWKANRLDNKAWGMQNSGIRGDVVNITIFCCIAEHVYEWERRVTHQTLQEPDINADPHSLMDFRWRSEVNLNLLVIHLSSVCRYTA